MKDVFKVLGGTIPGKILQALEELGDRGVFPVHNFATPDPEIFGSIKKLRELTEYEFTITCMIESPFSKAKKDRAILELLLRESIGSDGKHLLIYDNIIYIDNHFRQCDPCPQRRECILKPIFEILGSVAILSSKPRPIVSA